MSVYYVIIVFMYLCIYICDIITILKIINIFITPEVYLCPLIVPLSPILPLYIPKQLLICFLSLYVNFNFLEFYINGVIQSVFLGGGICIIILRSICVVLYINSSLLFLTDGFPLHIHFVYPFT